MNIRRLRASDCDPQEYLRGANAAFGQWGDEATFAWAFRGGEILFLDDARGRPAAASGITYRTLLDGREVAILTGAWTHPDARGGKSFLPLIFATHEAARERNAIVLAFGRRDNPSCRRVQEAGAQVSASYYCRSRSTATNALEVLEPEPARFRTGFRYNDDEWRTQFLERPHAQIECVGRSGEWAAIVERTAEFDRVHLISDMRALPFLHRGRRLFWFTLQRPELDCEWTDGFLSTFPAADVSRWPIQNGDRM